MLGYFLQDMLLKGEAIVQPELQQFDASDLNYAREILEAYYKTDIQNLANGAPEFDADAALWAAQYVYHSMQFLLLRQLKEEEIIATLNMYGKPQTAAAIYSADITLRHLPDLVNAAKGLAPDDVLVTKLNETATQWQYSSVGIAIQSAEISEAVLENNALRIEYIDRIVARRDKSRLQDAITKNMITEALGIHSESIWPGYKELLNGSN